MSEKSPLKMTYAGDAGGRAFYEVTLDTETTPTRRTNSDPVREAQLDDLIERSKQLTADIDHVLKR